METSETLVQRSTTHTELVRDTVVNVTPDTIHNKEQIPHVVVKFLLRYTTTEKIQQTEVSSHVETFVLTILLHQVIIILITITGVLITKSINLKGDIDLTTEPHQVHELFDSILDDTSHRTRPVQNEDKTVVLTIRDYVDLLKQVLVVLVGVEFGAVKDTSLGYM